MGWTSYKRSTLISVHGFYFQSWRLPKIKPYVFTQLNLQTRLCMRLLKCFVLEHCVQNKTLYKPCTKVQLSIKIRLVKTWVYKNWKFSCKNEFNQFCKRIKYVYIRKCLPREVLQKHFHLKSIIIFKISVLNNIICLVKV